MPHAPSSPAFRRFAWGVLAYTVAVVLWGAFVRATGSGAGCGDHWPVCNGEVLPRAPSVATLIEFTHRLTSGLAGVLSLGVLAWGLRAHPRGHPVRGPAVASFVLMVTEGAVGAGLVLFQLVADDASVARALFMSVHLVNTFLLLGAQALTALQAGAPVRLRLRGQGAVAGVLLAAVGGLLLVGVSGAVAALGDTLAPGTRLVGGERPAEMGELVYVLLQLRVLHPVLAVLAGAAAALGAQWVASVRPEARVRARALGALYVVQLVVGALNVYLLAPTWMQLVHLLLADVVWVALVALCAKALADGAKHTADAPAPAVLPAA